MKYGVEMGSGSMTYIPNFMKTGSDIEKLIWGDTQKQRHEDTDSTEIVQACFHFYK